MVFVSKVLLVDDDPTVLRIARIALEAIGLDVAPALDVAEARAIFREQRQEISALLCDIAMPGTNGLDLALEFRAARPELRVLLMSGKLDKAEVREPNGSGFRFIAKPFLPSDLHRKMEELLGCEAAELKPHAA
jgi:two-component system cell cycle sensor histidine kinase/response regulator CckA